MKTVSAAIALVLAVAAPVLADPAPRQELSIVSDTGPVVSSLKEAAQLPYEPRSDEFSLMLDSTRVDDWRFIEILERQKTASNFTETVRMRHLGHKTLWWGVGIGGLTLSAWTLTNVYNREGRSPALHEIFVIPLSLVGGLICLPVAAFWEPRQFTFTEAVGAVDEFNQANR